MTSAPAIGFEYRPSRWVPRLLIAITGLAIPAIWFSGVPLWARIALVAAVMLAGLRAVRQLRLPIFAVGWAGHGGWTLRGRDGADDAATLLSFRILRNVILLRLASRRYGRLSFWLMPDNLDPDTRRRLRMRLAVLRSAQENA